MNATLEQIASAYDALEARLSQLAAGYAASENKAEFSDDPEIERLCQRRAGILEFISTNQLTKKAYDDLCEQLGEIEVKLQQIGAGW